MLVGLLHVVSTVTGHFTFISTGFFTCPLLCDTIDWFIPVLFTFSHFADTTLYYTDALDCGSHFFLKKVTCRKCRFGLWKPEVV